MSPQHKVCQLKSQYANNANQKAKNIHRCFSFLHYNGASRRALLDLNRPAWLDSSRSAGPAGSAGSSQENQNLSGAVLVPAN